MESIEVISGTTMDMASRVAAEFNSISALRRGLSSKRCTDQPVLNVKLPIARPSVESDIHIRPTTRGED
jgi:hypothetical protein